MSQEYKIELHCECNHRNGLISMIMPWRQGRPCRRCRRRMPNQVITVSTPAGPTPSASVAPIVIEQQPPPPYEMVATTTTVAVK
uniref:Uncharacterized protein n=1 Tax=Haematobia irritans TaxID=7368 RepID=A0A1L8E7P0_HAEIR